MISVQVSVDLPIFQSRRKSPDIAAKVAQMQQARQLKEDAIRQYVAEARAMPAEWDAADSRLKRSDESLLPLARERARTALAAYRGGKGELAAVLSARRDELDLKMQQLQLQSDQALAYAQLLHFVHPEAVVPSLPTFEIMGLVGFLALAANSACFALLCRHRKEDVNMSSVWECSRNDIPSNLAVLLAAVGAWVFQSR